MHWYNTLSSKMCLVLKMMHFVVNQMHLQSTRRSVQPCGCGLGKTFFEKKLTFVVQAVKSTQQLIGLRSKTHQSCRLKQDGIFNSEWIPGMLKFFHGVPELKWHGSLKVLAGDTDTTATVESQNSSDPNISTQFASKTSARSSTVNARHISTTSRKQHNWVWCVLGNFVK